MYNVRTIQPPSWGRKRSRLTYIPAFPPVTRYTLPERSGRESDDGDEGDEGIVAAGKLYNRDGRDCHPSRGGSIIGVKLYYPESIVGGKGDIYMINTQAKATHGPESQ